MKQSQPWLLSRCWLAFLVLELCETGITCHMLSAWNFKSQLHSFRIHLWCCVCFSSSFSLLVLLLILLFCMDNMAQFISVFLLRHPWKTWFFTFINKTAVNSLKSLKKKTKKQNCMFLFVSCRQAVFPWGCTVLQSYNKRRGVAVALHCRLTSISCSAPKSKPSGLCKLLCVDCFNCSSFWWTNFGCADVLCHVWISIHVLIFFLPVLNLICLSSFSSLF